MNARLIKIKQQDEMLAKMDVGKTTEHPAAFFQPKKLVAYKVQKKIEEKDEADRFCVIL